MHLPRPQSLPLGNASDSTQKKKKKPLRLNAGGAKKSMPDQTPQVKPRSLLTRTALSCANLGIIFATASAFMALYISTTSL
jgi:hypothetical protein